MSHIEKRIKPYFWAVLAVASILALCSGAIEQILDSSAIHRFQGAAYDSVKNSYNSIITQFPQSTQTNRGLIAGLFVAIGGVA